MGKKIAIAAMKGGVGKTQLAVSIASTLVLDYNKKVLIVDTDPQSNSTNYLGVDDLAEGHISIKEAVENKLNPKEVVQDTYIENLKILPSSIYVTALEMTLMQLFNEPNKIYLKQFKEYFNQFEQYFDQFDYILYDTNPSMSLVNQNVFAMVDSICITTEPSVAGAKGVDLFIDLWSGIANGLGIDNKIDALALNRLIPRTNIGKEFTKYLIKGEYKELILKNFITESTVFKDAESYQKVIGIYKPSSKSNKQIKDIVKELIERKVL